MQFLLIFMQLLFSSKSSSISQLIKGKSKIIKYFNGTTISVSNIFIILYAAYCFCPILKRFTCYCLVIIYSIITSSIIGISIIIHFIHIILSLYSKLPHLTRLYLEFCFTHSLEQIITRLTRVTDPTATLINHILMNS